MSSIKIGWSEIDITPTKRASLIGQFAERISEYIEKPITATALSIVSDVDQMTLVSVDVNGISYNLVEKIREKLASNNLGIDCSKVIFSAIHTHTAPTYPRYNRTAECGLYYTNVALLKQELPNDKKYEERVSLLDNIDIVTSQEYFDFLVERLVEVTICAWKNIKGGKYVNEFGRVPVGMCRRVVYNDQSAKMWGDMYAATFEELEGGNDTGLELLYIFDSNKKITGVVANLACPAQCVQHRSFISPDFWGEVKTLLRNYFGEELFVLPLCSIAGDQCPVDLIRWVEPESELNDPNIIRNNPPKRKADPSMFDISGMKKTGRRIAREIIDIYENMVDEPNDILNIKHQVEILKLPVRRVSPKDIEDAKKKISDYILNKSGNVDYIDSGNLTGPLGDLLRAKIQEVMETLDSEIHVIKIDDIVIATNPFEPFIKYGNQIKARSKASQTFLVQLANGIEGYIPTEKAEKGGHYSGFVASGIVGHEGGDLLVRETVQCINKMFK